MPHIPVLVSEVLHFLDPKSGGNFVDCTLGDGGHTAEILKHTSPNGKVLAFDLDTEAIEVAAKNLAVFGDRLITEHASYTALADTVARLGFGPIAGVLADFGLSSPQLEDRGRGMSFMRDEALDMRFNVKGDAPTAAEIVNTWPKDDLTQIIAEYGEERLAERVSQAIVAARRNARIVGTTQLAEIIKNALPKRYEGGRIHPATRTFQALRIAVNGELESIKKVLPQALEVVSPGGILAMISFHSLEDRIVKVFFQEQKKEGKIEILTPRPLTATQNEIIQNPRSRSAKLRIARKL